MELQVNRTFEFFVNEIAREKKMLHAYNLQLEKLEKAPLAKKDFFFFEIYKFLNYK